MNFLPRHSQDGSIYDIHPGESAQADTRLAIGGAAYRDTPSLRHPMDEHEAMDANNRIWKMAMDAFDSARTVRGPAEIVISKNPEEPTPRNSQIKALVDTLRNAEIGWSKDVDTGIESAIFHEPSITGKLPAKFYEPGNLPPHLRFVHRQPFPRSLSLSVARSPGRILVHTHIERRNKPKRQKPGDPRKEFDEYILVEPETGIYAHTASTPDIPGCALVGPSLLPALTAANHRLDSLNVGTMPSPLVPIESIPTATAVEKL